MRPTLLSLSVLLSGVSLAADMPFGIQKGMSVKDVVSVLGGTKISATTYVITSIPKPHSDFKTYAVYATEKYGICKVLALSDDFKNDSYGTSIRSKFTELKSALRGKYGVSEDFDFLKAGALWKGSNEFIWSLYKNERVLSSYWEPKGGDIDFISLEAKASSSAASHLSLSYEFDNFLSCKTDADQTKNDSL